MNKARRFLVPLLISLAVTVSHPVFAQTNTFPSSGNVGIGTTSPNVPLVVQDNDNNWLKTLLLYNTNTGVNAQAGIQMTQGSNNGYLFQEGVVYWLWNEANGPMRFVTNGTTQMILAENGNLGIGTLSPTSRLYVAGGSYGSIGGANQSAYALGAQSIAADHSIYSYGAICAANGWGNCAGSGGVVLGINNSSAAVNIPSSGNVIFNTSGNVGIGTTSPSAKLHVNGNVTIDGNIAAKYQDLAEWVPAAVPIGAGTVVVIDPNGSNTVLPSSHPYDTRIAGVVSAEPGIVLGEQGDNKVKVATTGRVRVHVDATQAPIHAGDLLVTSEKSGVAMKSEPLTFGGVELHRPGTLIGKALEPLSEGEGEILVLLSLQ